MSYRIGELALLTGTSVRTLRFWTDLGLIPTARSDSGYRMYGPEAQACVAFIRTGQKLGLSLEAILRLLDAAEQERPPCEDVQQELRHRLEDVQAQIAALQQTEQALKATLQGLAVAPCDEASCRYVPRRVVPRA